MNPRTSRQLLVVAIAILAALLVFLSIQFVRLQPEGPGEILRDSGPPDMDWVRSMYGYGSAPEQMLAGPSSVTIDSEGDIYVTDPTRSRVMVFAPDGAFRRAVRSEPAGYAVGEFIRPEAIDVDLENGDLYIADSWARKVIIYDSYGVYLDEWPVDEQARGVAVTDDRVYVLDVGKVIAFSKEGERLFQFGERGSEPGQIDAYLGIVSDGESVYIADSYNRRIQAFSHDGELIWAAPVSARTLPPAPGSSESSDTVSEDSVDESDEALAGEVAEGEYAWELPQDLTIDGEGRLVVVDAFGFSVVVVDPEDGTVLEDFGEFGSLDGQLYYPTSIAYDPTRDWFAIADTENNRIQLVRIPDSGDSLGAAAARFADSSWRYALLPVAAFLASVLLAAWGWVRLQRRNESNRGSGQDKGIR